MNRYVPLRFLLGSDHPDFLRPEDLPEFSATSQEFRAARRQELQEQLADLTREYESQALIDLAVEHILTLSEEEPAHE